MMKRIISLILAIATCAVLFVACTNDTPDNPVDETTPQAVETTTPVETEPPAVDVSIIADGATEYTVIRPDDGETHKTAVSAAADLRVALSEATGATVKINSDWLKRGESAPAEGKEIVVGDCNRPENEAIRKSLRSKDFAIVYAGQRIYIVGGSGEATRRGTEYFMQAYVNKDTKSVTVKSDLHYVDVYDNYALGAVTINGVNLMDYTIVIPDKCDVLTEAAAQNLSDYLYYNGGMTLETVSDSEAATDYEILIGNTNRAESSKATSVSLADDQYVLAQTGSKIVMYGKGYMVGGAVSDFINNYATSATANATIAITNIPTECAAKTFEFKTPTSALLLIGDGMGFNHVEASLASGRLPQFVAQQLPNKGSAITASYSVQIGKKGYTDSAAAATALATGYKTVNGYVGLNHSGSSVQNVRELAHAAGAKTAVITTDAITGATPAGFLAHVKDRDLTDQIQSQINNLLSSGKVDYAISHKDSDNVIDAIREPLWNIAMGEKGYFSMIEAAYIDKRSHNVDLSGMIARVIRYDAFIAYCIEFTLCNPDSVLIITADHETGGLEKKEDGTFAYTNFTKVDYVQHTNADVPVYAIGKGTEMFKDARVDNTQIPKFIASIFGAQSFGQK